MKNYIKIAIIKTLTKPYFTRVYSIIYRNRLYTCVLSHKL